MERRLKDGGFQFSFDTLRCKFKPTAATLQVAEESGTDLAQAVKKLIRKREQASGDSLLAKLTPGGSGPGASGGGSSTSGAEAALGRVVGSLCVLTSKFQDAQSAMLASWVAQASFDPPGLTVAVAKDRAVESLVLPGGKFVLNVMSASNAREATRQLLKPFKPGEDRFAGVEVQYSERCSGAVIMPKALSFLECTVSSRMEAGDHWVIYATVDDGKLLDDTGVTAVHYRKSGKSY